MPMSSPNWQPILNSALTFIGFLLKEIQRSARAPPWGNFMSEAKGDGYPFVHSWGVLNRLDHQLGVLTAGRRQRRRWVRKHRWVLHLLHVSASGLTPGPLTKPYFVQSLLPPMPPTFRKSTYLFKPYPSFWQYIFKFFKNSSLDLSYFYIWKKIVNV